MCLVEIVSYTLPWRNQADAQVILRASQGQRPEDQLEGTPAALANVIKLCWSQNPQRRPGIQTVVTDLTALLDLYTAQASRPPSPDRSRPAETLGGSE